MINPLFADTQKRSVTMASMFDRNGTIYTQVINDGKKIQRSTGLKNTPENRTLVEKKILPVLELKVKNGDFSKKKPQNFQYYNKLYLKQKKQLKTYNGLVRKSKSVCEFFGSFQIDKLTRSDVKEWVAQRLEKNTPKTVRNMLSIVMGTIQEAVEAEVIFLNVAYKIQLPEHSKAEIEPFSSEEVKLLLSDAPDFLKLYLGIGFHTGLRTGEILALRVEDIDFENKIINVRRAISGGRISTTKTKKSIRRVPIFDSLLPYLNNLPSEGFLFHTQSGDHYSALPGHEQRNWVKLLKKNNLEYRKIYSTRHTFIVSMLQNSDLSILDVAQLAGHKNTKMIVNNYAMFIKNEHLKISRELDIFADKSADIAA